MTEEDLKDLPYFEALKREEPFYDKLFDGLHDDVNHYHSFLINGWGRLFNGGGIAEGYSGSLSDPDKIRTVFMLNDIDADILVCGGIYWC